jgi:serine/threonine protein kinase
LQRYVGSSYYCSPEILEGKSYDGDKADIFSIGALLFVLMTKNFAFDEAIIDNNSFIIKKILYKIIQTKQYYKYWELLERYFNIKDLSPNFKNLFLKMVAYNPEERPTIEEIRNDKFMSDIINASEEKLSFLRKKMINEIQC